MGDFFYLSPPIDLSGFLIMPEHLLGEAKETALGLE